MAILYPGALDTLATNLANSTPSANTHPNHHDDLALAVNALERASAFAPSYVIRKTGSNFEGLSPAGLAYVSPNADAAAVFQSCMDNMNPTTTPRGTIAFAPNTTFTWSTVPTMRRTYSSGGADDNGWLRVLGMGGSVISLSTAGKCFLAPNRQADYDGFCGLEVGDLAIDGNGINVDTNILFGTRTMSGQVAQRCDFRRLRFHDIDGYDIKTMLTADAKYVAFVWLRTTHLGLSEATRTYMTDIRFERIRIKGSNAGIVVAGRNAAAGDGRGLNIYGDRIHLEDIYYNMFEGSNAGTFTEMDVPASSCVQIGEHMFGDRITMDRCELIGSGDDGIELDNFRTNVIRDTNIRACKNGAYGPINFNWVNGTDNTEQNTQTWLFENCSYELARPGMPTNTPINRAFTIATGQTGVDIGNVIFRGCSMYCTAQLPETANLAAVFFYHSSAFPAAVNRVTFEDCNADIWLDVNGASNRTIRHMQWDKMPKELVIRELLLTNRGARTSSGQYTVEQMQINGTGKFDIDGLFYDDSTTGRVATTSFGMRVGVSTSDLAGTVRRYTVLSSPDTSFKAFAIGATATLTLRKLLVEDHDLRGTSGSAQLLSFTTGTQNGDKIWIRNPKDRVLDPPAEITFTPGATTVSAQYVGNYEGLMTVTGGTVTLVEISTDNSTFRTVGSGTNIGFYIDHGMYVRLTYSVTPTCKVIPRR